MLAPELADSSHTMHACGLPPHDLAHFFHRPPMQKVRVGIGAKKGGGVNIGQYAQTLLCLIGLCHVMHLSFTIIAVVYKFSVLHIYVLKILYIYCTVHCTVTQVDLQF